MFSKKHPQFRSTALFLGCLTMLLSATAQETIILNEQFNEPNPIFSILKEEGTDSKFKDGLFEFNNKNKGPNFIHLHLPKFDPNKEDFSIELKLKQLSGKKDELFGLYFGVSDDRQLARTFEISAAGRIQLMEVAYGKAFVDYDSTLANVVKLGHNFNTLKVVKRANILSYYINEHLFYQLGANALFEKTISLVIPPQSKIQYDYVKISKSPKLIPSVEAPLVEGKRKKLSSNINSEYAEISPVVTADGNTMYFVRHGHPLNAAVRHNPNDQDIWRSTRNKEGIWSKAINMGSPLNNELPNSVVSVSPGHNSMIVAHTYGRNGAPGGPGLSITKKTKEGWSFPVALVIKNYYNHSPFNDFFICPDNKTLLYAIQREDSYGKRDLYVSFLEADGSWSQPLHMGKELNTFGDENAPFVAADNSTLYFASDGHMGYGLHDIFVSKRLDDTWTNWSTPLNMGPSINTVGSDMSLFADARGEFVYLTQNGDIYSIENPKKPDPVVLMQGQALNQKTKEPMLVEISYFDLLNNKELGFTTSNEETGEYKILLPSGKKYSYVAKAKDFYAISNSIDLTDLKAYSEKTMDLFLQPIEKGESFLLNNLFFDYNKASLQAESFAELNRLLQLLENNPNLQIEIAGHTDNQGAADANLRLSQQRAEAVLNYLVEKGIASTRLKAVGYGANKPLKPNDTEENRAVNRRVEFRII